MIVNLKSKLVTHTLLHITFKPGTTSSDVRLILLYYPDADINILSGENVEAECLVPTINVYDTMYALAGRNLVHRVTKVTG